MRLDGKVALITSAGTGIGAAIAERFVKDGARICITGRRQEMLDRVAQSLPEGTVVTCAGDVTNLEDVRRMVDTALGFTGRLDVLVNNAAIDPGGKTVVDIDPDLWHQVLETNLTGPMYLMKVSIPHMVEAGGGSIINIASLGGLRCLPGMPAYCTSKAGLIMLTQQVALDFGPLNIRCNAVCPGGTRTALLEKSLTPLAEALGTDLDDVFAHISAMVPLRRTAHPDEIAGICSYLASDDSSFVTGAVFLADGGAAIVDISGAALTGVGVKWGCKGTRRGPGRRPQAAAQAPPLIYPKGDAMPQQEGTTNYKYEDYASEVAAYRLPPTDALVNQTLQITLDSGKAFELQFVEPNKVIWKSDGESGTDWCEVIEVAPNTYFIDMTFVQKPRESQTFIVNVQTRQVLGIRTIMREGDVGREPRAVHEFSPGALGDPNIPPTGRKPAPTRDLIGLRGLYDYSPTQCFEHIYLNSERYAWHCIVGPLRGQGDVDMSTIYKFDDNQYIFAFREFGLPVSTVFFYNWDQMRSTGKFFAIGEDGKIHNTPAGAIIRKLSVAFYPPDRQPI